MSLAMSVAAGMSGGRKSNAKGNSVEFSDFREYRFGDDIRRIDWNAYGRFDKLFIKLFMEEKEGLFSIFIDSSKSMDFGEHNKAVCALRLAGAVSYIVLQNGDRLFINVMDNGNLIEYKSMAGIKAFSKVTQTLESVSFSGNSGLFESVRHKDFKKRGTSFLITDGYTEELEDAVKYLKFKNQDVVLIQVLSREELEPEFEGTVNLIDSETGLDMRMTMSSQTVRDYKKSLDNFLARTQAMCKKYSCTYIRAISDESMESLLFGSLSKISTSN